MARHPMRSRSADWSHPKKPGRAIERLRFLDVLVQEAAGNAAMEAADAPGPPD